MILTPDEMNDSVQSLLDDRLALKTEISVLKDPSLVTKLPVYSVYADQVKAGDPLITARVRRDGFTNYSLSMRWKVNTSAIPAGYTTITVPTQMGEFVFDYDVDEILIQIPNPGVTGTKAFWIEIYNPRTYGDVSWKTSNTKTLVQALNSVVIPSLSVRGRSRKWNEPIKRPVPAGWTQVLKDDLLTNFESTDTGLRADGTPCYRSQLAHGRAQYTNAEVGFYVDPVLHPPYQPYQIINGKMALVAEKLPETMVYSEKYGLIPFADPRAQEAGNKKTVTHTSPIISTEKMPLFGYGRFSYKVAFPNATKGMWPAGWQLVLPHWRWPDLEQDTFEISFNQAASNMNSLVFPYQTNWWDKGNNAAGMQGQYANTFEFLKPFSWADPHELWMDWTPELIRWGIDDYMTFSVPTRLRIDPLNPEYNKVYMMLQIAIGGNAGSATAGIYPAYMLVDHIAHYAMPT